MSDILLTLYYVLLGDGLETWLLTIFYDCCIYDKCKTSNYTSYLIMTWQEITLHICERKNIVSSWGLAIISILIIAERAESARDVTWAGNDSSSNKLSCCISLDRETLPRRPPQMNVLNSLRSMTARQKKVIV